MRHIRIKAKRELSLSRCLFVIINLMNEGITFEEACKLTPEGLTSEQFNNCPNNATDLSPYLYGGIIAVVLIVIAILVAIKAKRAKC